MTDSERRAVRRSASSSRTLRRFGAIFLCSLAVAAVVLAVGQIQNRPGKTPPPRAAAARSPVAEQTAPSEAPNLPAASAAQRIYLDENGKRTAPPPGTFAAAEPPSPQKRAEPAVLRSVVPGGGEFVRLGDRFMVHSVATVGADGKVRVDCVADPDAPGHAAGCDHGQAGQDSEKEGVR